MNLLKLANMAKDADEALKDIKILTELFESVLDKVDIIVDENACGVVHICRMHNNKVKAWLRKVEQL